MIDEFIHWSGTIFTNLIAGDDPLGWRILAAWVVFFIWAFLIDCVLWLIGLGPKRKI